MCGFLLVVVIVAICVHYFKALLPPEWSMEKGLKLSTSHSQDDLSQLNADIKKKKQGC